MLIWDCSHIHIHWIPYSTHRRPSYSRFKNAHFLLYSRYYTPQSPKINCHETHLKGSHLNMNKIHFIKLDCTLGSLWKLPRPEFSEADERCWVKEEPLEERQGSQGGKWPVLRGNRTRRTDSSSSWLKNWRTAGRYSAASWSSVWVCCWSSSTAQMGHQNAALLLPENDLVIDSNHTTCHRLK